jgi:tetratricopeptide (TPR) repeat protein
MATGSSTSTAHARGICVWDLRRIREQLAARGSDLDLPPYAPSEAETNAVPPRLKVRLDAELYQKRGDYYVERGQYVRAVQDYRQALEMDPSRHWCRNRVAWCVAMSPSELHRLLPEALDLALEAVDRETIERQRQSHQVSLAAVLYRLGRYHECLMVLDDVWRQLGGRKAF